MAYLEDFLAKNLNINEWNNKKKVSKFFLYIKLDQGIRMQFVGYVVAHGETAAVLGLNPARLPVRVGSLADKLFQICTT